MTDVLCRWSGLAPWVAVILTVALQIAAISYSYGSLSQRQTEFEHRIASIEVSDKEQSKEMGEAASRLARIESGIDWLRQTAMQSGK